MDDPVVEITDVVLALTTTSPPVQQATIDKYFTADAEFIHPFCRTVPSASSRYQLSRIYRWYKIMSPEISIKVNSIALDQKNDILYVGITQVFAIRALPLHQVTVSLVAELQLVRMDHRVDHDAAGSTERTGEHETQGGGKWYIKSQNDLYQTDQFLKFILFPVAGVAVLWQYLATLGCILLSYLFTPVTWALSCIFFSFLFIPVIWEKAIEHRHRRHQIQKTW